MITSTKPMTELAINGYEYAQTFAAFVRIFRMYLESLVSPQRKMQSVWQTHSLKCIYERHSGRTHPPLQVAVPSKE